jgi:hypothetical protein
MLVSEHSHATKAAASVQTIHLLHACPTSYMTCRYFVAQTHVASQIRANKIQPFSLDASTFYSKYNISKRPYPPNLNAASLVGGHTD